VQGGEKAAMLLLGVFLTYHLLMPLRPLLYPGPVARTEEGHRFSWRMKLRDKAAHAQFTVLDPVSGNTWRVNPRAWLTDRQAGKMPSRPDMILQFAHYLDRVWREKRRVPDAVVTAQVLCSLNYRKPALLVDPERDLSRMARTLDHADWIRPLDPALEPGYNVPPD
jgi:hypothetical protein